MYTTLTQYNKLTHIVYYAFPGLNFSLYQTVTFQIFVIMTTAGCATGYIKKPIYQLTYFIVQFCYLDFHRYLASHSQILYNITLIQIALCIPTLTQIPTFFKKYFTLGKILFTCMHVVVDLFLQSSLHHLPQNLTH